MTPSQIYDIAAGLEYLHGQSLVHSDIKGVSLTLFLYRCILNKRSQMNILVDDSERACITDFGLSFVRTDQTLAYTLAATTAQGLSYRWAAPELLEDGVRATLASDVWALGCVFYEMKISLPFNGELIWTLQCSGPDGVPTVSRFNGPPDYSKADER